jgi:hypothetical protein
MTEKYGNRSSLEKEFPTLNGSSIKINITIKKCGAIPRKRLSITSSSIIRYALKISWLEICKYIVKRKR